MPASRQQELLCLIADLCAASLYQQSAKPIRPGVSGDVPGRRALKIAEGLLMLSSGSDAFLVSGDSKADSPLEFQAVCRQASARNSLLHGSSLVVRADALKSGQPQYRRGHLNKLAAVILWLLL